jgi:hypothetical protein
MGTPPENVETTIVTDATPGGDDGKQSVTPQQLAIVGGVVVVIVLALVYFFFLRGGGEDETVAPPPTAEGVPAPEETAPAEEDAAEEDEDEDGEVETFEVFAPRDPFEALVSANPVVGGTGGEAPTDGGTADGDVGGDPIDGGTDGAPSDDGETIGQHRVRVVDVFTENGQNRAQIQVDGTVYTVDEGEEFAGNFQLVSASGTCATILFGDDEFTLCEGETILK